MYDKHDKRHAKTTTSIHKFIHHTQIYPYMYLYNLKKSPPLSIFSIYNTGSHNTNPAEKKHLPSPLTHSMQPRASLSFPHPPQKK